MKKKFILFSPWLLKSPVLLKSNKLAGLPKPILSSHRISDTNGSVSHALRYAIKVLLKRSHDFAVFSDRL